MSAFLDGFREELVKLSQFRERVEIYALSPGGKVLTSYFESDKSVQPPGGGIELGETPEEAAAREFREETNRYIHNVQMLGIPPTRQPWLRPDLVSGAARLKRLEMYPEGTKTYYLTGTVGKKRYGKQTDDLLKNVGLQPLQDMIAKQEEAIKRMTGETKKRGQIRLKILKGLS